MATLASSNQQHYQYPDWQRPYHLALLEINRCKLLELVEAAEKAIYTRFQEISEASDRERERQAIFDAQATLAFLRLDARKP